MMRQSRLARAGYVAASEATRGVIVTGIRATGAAASKLETGDVLREVQGREVKDLAGFLKLAAQSIRSEDAMVRLILRRGSVLDVTVLRPEYK